MPKLSRFFDKKKEVVKAAPPRKNLDSTQGSLLDLMDDAPKLSPVETAPFTDRRAEHALNSWIVERAKAAQHLANIKNQHDLQSRLEKQRHQAATSNRFGDGQKPGNSQQQLNLLADELASIRLELQEATALPERIDAPSSHSRPAMRQTDHRRRSSNPFSFENVLGAVLRAWRWMLVGGLVGAALAAMIALALPNKYESVAEILIEPRGLRVLDNSVAPNELNSEATVAYAESQVSIIRSLSVIDPVIKELKLTQDPEFNGQQEAVGGLLGLLASFFTTQTEGSNALEFSREYLHENLTVSRVNQTFAINIAVATEFPEKSAAIANALARSYIADESGARSSAAKNASEDLLGRLSALRKMVRISEEKAEAYKTENDLIVAGGQLVSEAQLTRLNDQMAIAQVQTGEARTKSKQAALVDLGDVISGSLPSSLINPSITQLRSEYAKVRTRASTLAVKLGARHPKRVAVTVELGSIKSSIRSEIKRLISSAKVDYASARSREQDLVSKINELKAVVSGSSSALVNLREMQREVVANRKVYEAFLERSREISELENIRSESARLISVAALPLKKNGPNRKFIVASGGILGSAFGGFLGLIPFILSGLRKFSRKLENDDLSAEAAGDLYSSEEPQAEHSIYTQWSPQPLTKA